MYTRFMLSFFYMLYMNTFHAIEGGIYIEQEYGY